MLEIISGKLRIAVIDDVEVGISLWIGGGEVCVPPAVNVLVQSEHEGLAPSGVVVAEAFPIGDCAFGEAQAEGWCARVGRVHQE